MSPSLKSVMLAPCISLILLSRVLAFSDPSVPKVLREDSLKCLMRSVMVLARLSSDQTVLANILC